MNVLILMNVSVGHAKMAAHATTYQTSILVSAHQGSKEQTVKQIRMNAQAIRVRTVELAQIISTNTDANVQLGTQVQIAKTQHTGHVNNYTRQAIALIQSTQSTISILRLTTCTVT